MQRLLLAATISLVASAAFADSGHSPYHAFDRFDRSVDYSTTAATPSARSGVAQAGGGDVEVYIRTAIRAAESNLRPQHRDQRVNHVAAARIRAEIQAIRNALNSGNLSAGQYNALLRRIQQVHRDVSAAMR